MTEENLLARLNNFKNFLTEKIKDHSPVQDDLEVEIDYSTGDSYKKSVYLMINRKLYNLFPELNEFNKKNDRHI